MIRFTKSKLLPTLCAVGMSAAFQNAVIPTSLGQDACCFEPTYRLQCETVMQPQTVQRMRLSYETEYVDEQVTSYRPVLKTRTEEREYQVAVPVTETSFREERFTVWKPVVETSYRDETVQQTSYVTETAEREEKYTTFKPVVETQYYQQRYAVQRPVTETQMYEQRYAVQRPVTETQWQTQQYTTMRPVTTVQNQTYDAGGYQAQQTVVPGQVQYGLQYVRGAYATPGPLGLFARVRGAYAVTPQVTAPTVQTQYAYRPNYITQQVAKTSLVPQTQQVNVPVQVQRMQTEVVTQRVPVSVQRMQTEMVTQNVPVQTTRMVPTTEVRKVPYVVTKPVTQTMTRKVPVRQQRWVTEEKVRKVPVQSTRVTYQTRKEPVQVSYYEQEAIVQTVRKPVTRQVYVPYTETVMVPQQVTQKVPLSYYDPFSPAIVSGYSSFANPTPYSASMVPMSSSPVVESYSVPEVSQPIESMGGSVLESPRSLGDLPRTKMQKIEIDPPTPSQDSQESSSDEVESDFWNLPQPELNAPTEGSGDSGTDATEAGWKIHWMPRFAREA